MTDSEITGDVSMRELSSTEVDGVAGAQTVEVWISRTLWMLDLIVNQGAKCTFGPGNRINCETKGG